MLGLKFKLKADFSHPRLSETRNIHTPSIHTPNDVCGNAHSVVPGSEPSSPAAIARLLCQPVAKPDPNKIYFNLENNPIT